MSWNPIRTARTARMAGLLYVVAWVMTLLAIGLRSQQIVGGDPVATAANIRANSLVWTLGIASDLIVQIAFVALVLLLHRLFAHVDRSMAIWMVVLFLVSVPMAQVGSLSLIGAQWAADQALPGQAGGLVALFLRLSEGAMMIAYPFWGLWLIPLGVLVYRSGVVPRFIGVYLVLGSVGYLVDASAFFLAPDLGVSVNLITGWGELLLCLWLVVSGHRLVGPSNGSLRQ